MYHVSAEGVDERMINVHYYYYICFFFFFFFLWGGWGKGFKYHLDVKKM